MSRRRLPGASERPPLDRVPAAASPLPLPPRRSVLRPLVAAAVIELALIGALVHFAARKGVVAAPHPQRVRIAMLAPKPKPKPPAPKPPPPPPPKPKPPPPPPPKPKPPPPKPLPKPPPPPPPRPAPKRVIHRPPPPRPRPVPHHPAPPRPVPPPMRAVTPPAPSPAEVASMVMRYAAELNGRVQSRLVVPEAVQMMHLSGKTVVAIRVAPDGALLGVSVARSSGAGPIDRAALAAVRATRLPPFGPGMPDHPVTFDLTVRIKN